MAGASWAGEHASVVDRPIVVGHLTHGAAVEPDPLAPEQRRSSASHGNRISTWSFTGSPDAGTPAHGPRFVPVSSAASNTPCGPTTMSVSANRLSGKAANSSV